MKRRPEPTNPQETFDYGERYFRHCVPGIPYTESANDKHWPKFFGSIADLILREITPSTVLDAGCATGFPARFLLRNPRAHSARTAILPPLAVPGGSRARLPRFGASRRGDVP